MPKTRKDGSETTCWVCGSDKEPKKSCAMCLREYKMAWYRKNIETAKRKEREYYEKHPEKYEAKLENVRKWHKDNADYVKTQKIEYNRKNFEAISAKKRVKNQRARELLKVTLSTEELHLRHKAHYAKYKGKMAAYAKIYQRENAEKVRLNCIRRRVRKKNAFGSHSNEEWHAILSKHKNSCAKCGVSGSVSKLTRDHKVPLSKGGTDFAYNIQPLCTSCNCSKNAKLLPDVQFSLFDKVAT